MPLAGTFALDAGDSYDEDDNVNYGAAAGLTFAWRCDVPACDASLELDLGAVKDVSLVTLYPWQLAVAALGTYELWLSDVQGSALGLHRGAAPPHQPAAGLGGAAA